MSCVWCDRCVEWSKKWCMMGEIGGYKSEQTTVFFFFLSLSLLSWVLEGMDWGCMEIFRGLIPLFRIIIVFLLIAIVVVDMVNVIVVMDMVNDSFPTAIYTIISNNPVLKNQKAFFQCFWEQNRLLKMLF